MKVCRTCKKELSLDCFGIKYKNYLQPDCKKCKRAGQKERSIYHRTWQEANRERVNKIADDWRKKFPNRVNNINSRNRAKRLQATIQTDDWLNQQMLSVIYLLANTLSKGTGIPHEVDHIVPLGGKNVCGLHYWKNLQVLTREENRVKSNKY